jgi:hypothetical protein
MCDLRHRPVSASRGTIRQCRIGTGAAPDSFGHSRPAPPLCRSGSRGGGAPDTRPYASDRDTKGLRPRVALTVPAAI